MEILNVYSPGTIGDIALYVRVELDELYSYKFWEVVAFAQANACWLVLDDPARQMTPSGDAIFTGKCRYLHIEFYK